MRRPPVAAIVVAAVLSACGSDSGQEPTPPGRDGDVQAIGALGRLEPQSEIREIGATGGRLARLLVTELAAVRAGDALGHLEAHDERRAARDLAAALVRDAEVRDRQVRELQPLEVEAQRARVRAAEAELETERKALARTRGLEADGVLTEEQLDRDLLRVRRAEEQLEVERTVLAEAERRLELDVQLAEARLATAARELQLAEARLESTVLRAPIDGRVLKIHVHPGEKVDEGPILQMGDTSVMHAVAEVYETEVSRVRVGQRATITSPTLTSPAEGEVERVGAIIFKNDVLDVDPAAKADARVVEVRIRMDDSAPLADLTNLQVDVLIHVGVAQPATRE